MTPTDFLANMHQQAAEHHRQHVARLERHATTLLAAYRPEELCIVCETGREPYVVPLAAVPAWVAGSVVGLSDRAGA